MIAPKPQWSLRLLRWYCHPDFEEDISGDLEELFQQRQQQVGQYKARWLLLRDVLVLCRPEIIGLPHFTYPTNHTAMFRNYFILTWRSLKKSRLYAFINILSLAIAMAVVILIAVFVSYDLSFDEYPPNDGHIYRHTVELVGSDWNSAKSFPGLGPYLLDHYGQVEDFTRIYATPETGSIVTPFPGQAKKFIERQAYYADVNVFDFFSLPLLQGNPDRLLNESNQVMLSATLAEKYFGADWRDKNLLGHTLQLTNFGNKDTKLYTLSGIFQKRPNSHFRPDMILSMSSLPKERWDALDQFNWVEAFTYLQLQPDTDVLLFKNAIDSLLHEITWGKSWLFDCKLQKLSDIHHISHYRDDMEAGADIRLNYFLIGVAIFIMICAWVNFVNMSIAKSLKRAKEVGVRKTLGANRGSIVLQFLLEGFWLNLLSGLLAIMIALLSFPLLDHHGMMIHTSWPLQLWVYGAPQLLPFVLFMAGMILTGTLISGMYPALVLSSYRPISVLRGLQIVQRGRLGLRHSLLTVQFVISALLMIGIFAATSQLNYMLNKDLGFEKEQKLVISTAVNDINSVDNYLLHAQNLKKELQHIQGVKAISTASSVPGLLPGGDLILCRIEKVQLGDPTLEDIFNEGPTPGMVVDAGFFDFYDIELVAGRGFSPETFNDAKLTNQHLLVNEQFAVLNGFDPVESIVGTMVYVQQNKEDGEVFREPREIIGVVENHHQYSVKEAFQPMVFSPEGTTLSAIHFDKKIPHAGSMRYFSLSIPLGENPNQQIKHLINEVETLWQQHLPELAFEYFFLDEAFNRQYEIEIRISKIFSVFGALSIFISCLGLFGLSSYLIQQRTKEIGIRKVLGASLQHLFSLLSTNYIKLVAISSLMAIPIAWWGIHQWLDNYAFRIELQWWFFALPLLALLLIALCTISFRVISAATANPVDSLRYE